MQDMSGKLTGQLADLTGMVRRDLSSEARKKVNTLIITDVHARDIIETFVRDSVMDAREFAWESQLRFYWDRTADDLLVRQCTGQHCSDSAACPRSLTMTFDMPEHLPGTDMIRTSPAAQICKGCKVNCTVLPERNHQQALHNMPARSATVLANGSSRLCKKSLSCYTLTILVMLQVFSAMDLSSWA